MKTILWLVGAPGVGKTTLARRFIPLLSRVHPSPKWTVGRGVVAAGHYTGGTFDGADTVPYNGVKVALTFWQATLALQANLTLLDGDRFSSAGVLQFFRELPFGASLRCACAYLALPVEVAEARRQARGGGQNPAWVKGRQTKSLRFFEMFPEEARVSLDARMSSEALAVRLKSFLGGAP